MRKEHHYQQEEESRAVIPSLSALISGAKQCQGDSGCFVPWALKKQAKLRASNFSLYSEAPHPASSCPPRALKAWLQLDTCIWGWQLFHQLLSWKQRAGLCAAVGALQG